MFPKLAALSATFTLAAASGEVGRTGTVNTVFAPAFLKVENNNQLFSSTFFNINGPSKFHSDGVYTFDIDSEDFPGSFKKSSQRHVIKATWPNEVLINYDIFKGPEGEPLQTVSIAGGFIFGKGEVYATMEVNKEYVHFQVSPPNSGGFGRSSKWMYHRAEFIDMDGDGHLDFLTARSDYSIPPFLSSYFTGQVVWYKNPGTVTITQEMLDVAARKYGDMSSVLPHWEEFIIDDGSEFGSGDVNFKIADLDGDGKIEIICTHFWDNAAGSRGGDKDTPAVVIYTLKDGASWATGTYPETVERVVIADDIGGPFDLELHDMNGDGKKDLLVSNHQAEYEEAKVFVFEIPSGKAWKTTPWPQHVIHSGFLTRLNNGLSPGAAQAFHPSKAHLKSGKKPWVIVSGDGTGYVHMLKPVSESKTSWDYEHFIVYDTALDHRNKPKTTGAIALTGPELDCTFIYVPAYEAGQIVVFNACEFENNLDQLREQTKPYDEAVQRALGVAVASTTTTAQEPQSTISIPAMAGAAAGGAALVAISAFTIYRVNRARRAAATTDVEAGVVSSTNPMFGK